MDGVFWICYTLSTVTYFCELRVRNFLFFFFFFLFQLGGGYLFGLPVGFLADSLGATIGATAAFILGRTVSLLKILILWFLWCMFADMHAFFFLLQILLFYFLKTWTNVFLFELAGFGENWLLYAVVSGAYMYLLFVFSFLTIVQIGRSYVNSKLQNYPKFQAVAIAIQTSGFKA
jgi:hypothetical protein